eukprot:augustus_masked-scaffold_18-processed-gene-6.9-mRNA-1 protein AED:1.00 eAED:1.00 QI:0/0/0/0/1/1/2/0/1367
MSEKNSKNSRNDEKSVVEVKSELNNSENNEKRSEKKEVVVDGGKSVAAKEKVVEVEVDVPENTSQKSEDHNSRHSKLSNFLAGIKASSEKSSKSSRTQLQNAKFHQDSQNLARLKTLGVEAQDQESVANISIINKEREVSNPAHESIRERLSRSQDADVAENLTKVLSPSESKRTSSKGLTKEDKNDFFSDFIRSDREKPTVEDVERKIEEKKINTGSIVSSKNSGSKIGDKHAGSKKISSVNTKSHGGGSRKKTNSVPQTVQSVKTTSLQALMKPTNDKISKPTLTEEKKRNQLMHSPEPVRREVMVRFRVFYFTDMVDQPLQAYEDVVILPPEEDEEDFIQRMREKLCINILSDDYTEKRLPLYKAFVDWAIHSTCSPAFKPGETCFFEEGLRHALIKSSESPQYEEDNWIQLYYNNLAQNYENIPSIETTYETLRWVGRSLSFGSEAFATGDSLYLVNIVDKQSAQLEELNVAEYVSAYEGLPHLVPDSFLVSTNVELLEHHSVPTSLKAPSHNKSAERFFERGDNEVGRVIIDLHNKITFESKTEKLLLYDDLVCSTYFLDTTSTDLADLFQVMPLDTYFGRYSPAYYKDDVTYIIVGKKIQDEEGTKAKRGVIAVVTKTTRINMDREDVGSVASTSTSVSEFSTISKGTQLASTSHTPRSSGHIDKKKVSLEESGNDEVQGRENAPDGNDGDGPPPKKPFSLKMLSMRTGGNSALQKSWSYSTLRRRRKEKTDSEKSHAPLEKLSTQESLQVKVEPSAPPESVAGSSKGGSGQKSNHAVSNEPEQIRKESNLTKSNHQISRVSKEKSLSSKKGSFMENVRKYVSASIAFMIGLVFLIWYEIEVTMSTQTNSLSGEVQAKNETERLRFQNLLLAAVIFFFMIGFCLMIVIHFKDATENGKQESLVLERDSDNHDIRSHKIILIYTKHIAEKVSSEISLEFWNKYSDLIIHGNLNEDLDVKARFKSEGETWRNLKLSPHKKEEETSSTNSDTEEITHSDFDLSISEFFAGFTSAWIVISTVLLLFFEIPWAFFLLPLGLLPTAVGRIWLNPLAVVSGLFFSFQYGPSGGWVGVHWLETKKRFSTGVLWFIFSLVVSLSPLILTVMYLYDRATNEEKILDVVKPCPTCAELFSYAYELYFVVSFWALICCSPGLCGGCRKWILLCVSILSKHETQPGSENSNGMQTESKPLINYLTSFYLSLNHITMKLSSTYFLISKKEGFHRSVVLRSLLRVEPRQVKERLSSNSYGLFNGHQTSERRAFPGLLNEFSAGERYLNPLFGSLRTTEAQRSGVLKGEDGNSYELSELTYYPNRFPLRAVRLDMKSTYKYLAKRSNIKPLGQVEETAGEKSEDQVDDNYFTIVKSS